MRKRNHLVMRRILRNKYIIIVPVYRRHSRIIIIIIFVIMIRISTVPQLFLEE